MMEYPMVHSLKLRTWYRKLGELAEGVKPGVSLAAGAFCEFSLAVVLNLAILYSMSEPLSGLTFLLFSLLSKATYSQGVLHAFRH